MHFAYCTEEPLWTYPEDEARKRGDGVNALTFSNRSFNPVDAARLYEERLEELLLAEEVGFDGVMFNEHHNMPFTMHPRVNISAAVAAALTTRLKIILLGNPLPLWSNPLQLAEELGMIDLISKGRLVPGIVRGGGAEQLALNANPAYNRELFEEVHDLLVKIWTAPGPFRWEGNHFQFRVVNPWTLPLQQPHPRIYCPARGRATRWSGPLGTGIRTLRWPRARRRHSTSGGCMAMPRAKLAMRQARRSPVTW